MSHEIRTPMNGIMVMADLLANADIPRRLHRYAEVIATSGRSLLSIINDILDFSKIEAGKLELESGQICLDEVVENVTSLFAERASSKNIDLAAVIDPDVPRMMSGDPVRLSQVVGNLVNNALKFTENGFVRLAVSKCAVDSRFIDLSVEDSGIGIPEDKLSTIFEVFSQADQSTTRKFGGTGLGLAICRRIVTAMGGDVEVSSTVASARSFASGFRPERRPAGRGRRSPSIVGATRLHHRRIGGGDRFGIVGLFWRLRLFGHARRERTSTADYGSAAMVCADADRLSKLARSDNRPAESPIVVAVTRFGDATADAVIANGVADAAISRPLLRSEIEELLRRVAAGEKHLHSRAAGQRRGGPLPRFREPQSPGRGRQRGQSRGRHRSIVPIGRASRDGRKRRRGGQRRREALA